MRRLFPPPTPTSPTGTSAPGVAEDRPWTREELADAYAYPERPPSDGAWLRANMVTSLDGAAHHGGLSERLSGPADKRVFGVLRALSDVVVVGAETVRREGYRPARVRTEFAARRAAAGQGPTPAIAVVSASLALDLTLPLFAEPAVPTLVLTGAGAPRDAVAAVRAAGVEVLVAGDGAGVDPRRVKPVLAERGHTRLLCEGGPRLLGQLVAAGALDELCLTTAPKLALGSAPRVAYGEELPLPSELVLTDLLTESGYVFSRYRRV
ncbi:pyrimidine reductase family protein [Streptomyces sp. 4N509B]|uniref:pyrimidine reductase family protein n=1 Tax=Streptomyces sp. 4N509B TaxID=3457413 RepID=UPI003FD4C557